MNFKLEHRLPYVKEYQRLRQSAGWSKVSDRMVRKALEHSLFSVVAEVESSVVAMGRVVGDGALYFYIQDVVVLPEFRSKGLGTSVMVEIENYLKASAETNAFVGLMAAKGVEKFYHRFGYSTRQPQGPGMYKLITADG